MLRFEHRLWSAGFTRVAGVDEAGRGPLAGPVVVGAVIFEPAFVRTEARRRLAGLTDSKRLSEKERAEFFQLLNQCPAVCVAVGRAEVEEIDRLNILRATHLAMARALEALPQPPDHVLVDGLPVPGLRVAVKAIVGGDGRSLSIAAASVVAKVVRDRIMAELDRQYPQYGFTRHKGYSTPEHLAALRRYGPSPCHRRTFSPVSQLTLPFGNFS